MSRMTLRDTKNAGITSDWVRTEHAHWRVCVGRTKAQEYSSTFYSRGTHTVNHKVKSLALYRLSSAGL